MKKILLITQRCPFPPYLNGGVHTVYNILKNIPSNVEIDLFYYYSKDDVAEFEIKKYVHQIEHKNLYRTPNKRTRLFNFLKGIPDYFSEVELGKYDIGINYGKYDTIILDQIFSLPFANYIPNKIPIISMMHDNNVMMYERKRKNEKGILKYIYNTKQCIYFENLEKKHFNKIKKVIYVSALDASIAKKLHSECTAIFDNISLGVDLPTEEQISEPISNSIVFSGVMDYGPNEDAAFYFASEVFPRIKNRVKNARFVIAGKNPTRLLMGLSSDCIHITGFVEDMYKTITNSEIYVSPLRYGSGTKNKVLEAMAAGMPVFLTAVSREGIDGLVDGYNCIFIDENNIVDKICNWLNNKDELDAIAKNGKEYVEKNHSWNDSFDKFLLD